MPPHRFTCRLGEHWPAGASLTGAKMGNWTFRLVTLLGLVLSSAAGAAVEMAAPVEYPHAGLTLAVPEGFEFLQPLEPADIVRAVAMENKVPVQSVHLLALPVAEDVTAETFARGRMAQLRQDLAVRHLEVLKETTMPVAGIAGRAQRLKYTYRGQPTEAASVCFVREVSYPAVRICYLLTVECVAERAETLLPILGEVVKSIKLTVQRRTEELPAGQFGPPVRDLARGYSIRPPLRWFLVRTANGLAAAQADLSGSGPEVGGLPLPQMRVITQQVAADATGESCAQDYVKRAIVAASAPEGDLRAELLRHGPTTLAGRKGWQFLVRQAPKAEAQTRPAATTMPAATRPAATRPAEARPQAMIIAQRTICVPCDEGQRKSYSLVLLYPGAADEAAEKMLGQLAEGFDLCPVPRGPATQPMTAPSPAKN